MQNHFSCKVNRCPYYETEWNYNFILVVGTCEWDKKENYPLYISMAFKQISTQNKDCHQKGFNFTVDW